MTQNKISYITNLLEQKIQQFGAGDFFADREDEFAKYHICLNFFNKKYNQIDIGGTISPKDDYPYSEIHGWVGDEIYSNRFVKANKDTSDPNNLLILDKLLSQELPSDIVKYDRYGTWFHCPNGVIPQSNCQERLKKIVAQFVIDILKSETLDEFLSKGYSVMPRSIKK
ncbi:MAG TPA: hypothetical protein PLX15_00435 [Candidatus Woesearchaeota archaeon]|nr:hypothetical protein [Candidatus Woesearchaeota archaeon]